MSDESGNLCRELKEFLDEKISKKAGVLDIRYGTNPNPQITGMEYDSRKIKKGNLFFALPGLHTNGAKFIADALKNGAAVIVHGDDFDPDKPELNIKEQIARYPEAAYIKVNNPRFAMSPMADAFYNHPSGNMAVIGVTGTEGKSTTVYLIYQLLKLLGCNAGFISTVMLGNGKTEMWNPEHQTTPEAPTIHKILAEMRNNGVEFAVVESSSHGLSKRTKRLADVIFDVGVMTNVTHEHLEFHGTWEQYRYDKAELFRALDCNIQKNRVVPCFGVVNADDPSALYLADATKQKTYTYSTKGAHADLSIKHIESSSNGNQYEVNAWGEKISIQDKLPGAFNAGNVLAALLVVSQILSMNIRKLTALVPRLVPVRGRMNAIEKGQPFEVVVDYAHTPSSFMAIFPPLRERLDKSGRRIISLFGSAGERDTKKRGEQGQIAAEYSDIVILSDEDPRGEVPMTILEEIASGIKSPEMKRGENLFLIPDRPQAIRKAFSLARNGDLVLLLGKGHENSIIYANETRPYDEISEAEKALAEIEYTANVSGGAR